MSLLPNLDSMTDEEKLAALESIHNSINQSKEIQKKKVAENVNLVLQALKRIEADMLERVQGSAQIIENRVNNIKDGKDGINGRDGKDGKDGRPGRDGKDGRNGRDGLQGLPGADGQDGVGVSDAHIDFDGSLIITLTNGNVINVGEVVAPDLAESIKVISNGGGTSQGVLDTLDSLQTQITALQALGATSYQGTWNASTNTPTITSSVGTKGYYYVVSVAGSTSINSETRWGVGDWIIFNGSVWQKVDGGSTGNLTDLTVSNSLTLSGGTANGVGYLNGSKVFTTGTGLTFDGTTLTVNRGASGIGLATSFGSAAVRLDTSVTHIGNGEAVLNAYPTASPTTAAAMVYQLGGTEYMRLTSTGLGIGTSSPNGKLDVAAGNVFITQDYELNWHTSGTKRSQIIGDSSNNLKFSNRVSGTLTETMRLDTSGNLGIGTTTPSTFGKLAVAGNVVPTVTNSYTLGTSTYAWSNIFATTMTVGGYAVVDQSDIGTAANEIPLNQYLGNLAYQDASSIAGPVGIGGAVTLFSGTANGVPYLNSSKVLTTGSALTFDGTANLTIGNSNAALVSTGNLYLDATGGGAVNLRVAGYAASIQVLSTSIPVFSVNSVEGMRLTSTGLGIGTSSPGTKVDIVGTYRTLQNGSDTFTGTGVSYYQGNAANNEAFAWQQSAAGTNLNLWTYSTTLGIGWTSRFSFNAAGNLGLATTSPANGVTYNANVRVLGIAGSGSASSASYGAISLTNNRATPSGADDFGKISFGSANDTGPEKAYIYATAVGSGGVTGGYGGNLVFATRADNAGLNNNLTLTSSGNLGLGVNPSAWATLTALQIKNAHFGGYSDQAYFGANAYYNGGWKYIAAARATRCEQYNGEHQWFTAASGTAGNAISFTQAMTLDASGQLLIGTTSASGLAQKYVDINAAANVGINLKAGDVGQGYIYADDTADEFRLAATGASNVNKMTFYAGGSERARIDSSGNLLIGTTTSGASKLVVNSDSIQVNTSKTPASATATGTTGQIAWDANYIYVCTATNTWKRTALATW